MNEDKRRGPRLRCNGTAMVQQSMEVAPFKARLIDLSVEGCLVLFPEPQPMALHSYVELTFVVNQLPFRVRGQVKSLRTENMIGFHFPTLSLRIRGHLEDLVEELIEDCLKYTSASAASVKTLTEERR